MRLATIANMNEDCRIERRQLLRQGAAGLFAAGLWPGALRADGAKPGEDFHFLVVNDTHYLDKRCAPWLEKALAQMKSHKEKIDFCILAGDLAENGTREQLSAMRDLLKQLKMAIHVVVGNHDYHTERDREAYEKLFPDQINYDFEHRGWQFVGLDTTQGQAARNTSIQPATFAWLQKRLPKLDRQRPTAIFTHFPMGYWVIGRPKNADELLGLFKAYNLQAVFCGHWHGYTSRHMGKAELTTNRCCSFQRKNHDGTPEKGYFLCHASQGKVERKFVEVPVPQAVGLG